MIKCPHCQYDGDHKISFNFNAPDLKRIQAGEKIMPGFRIRCDCGDCGRYIKFLPFKDNLVGLNNKSIDL